MREFIITEDGSLKFGDVGLHRDFIPYGQSTCYGGGFWQQNGRVLLSGRSFDFGASESKKGNFRFMTGNEKLSRKLMQIYKISADLSSKMN